MTIASSANPFGRRQVLNGPAPGEQGAPQLRVNNRWETETMYQFQWYQYPQHTLNNRLQQQVRSSFVNHEAKQNTVTTCAVQNVPVQQTQQPARACPFALNYGDVSAPVRPQTAPAPSAQPQLAPQVVHAAPYQAPPAQPAPVPQQRIAHAAPQPVHTEAPIMSHSVPQPPQPKSVAHVSASAPATTKPVAAAAPAPSHRQPSPPASDASVPQKKKVEVAPKKELPPNPPPKVAKAPVKPTIDPSKIKVRLYEINPKKQRQKVVLSREPGGGIPVSHRTKKTGPPLVLKPRDIDWDSNVEVIAARKPDSAFEPPFHLYGRGNTKPITDDDFLLTFNAKPVKTRESKRWINSRRSVAHNYDGWKDPEILSGLGSYISPEERAQQREKERKQKLAHMRQSIEQEAEKKKPRPVSAGAVVAQPAVAQPQEKENVQRRSAPVYQAPVHVPQPAAVEAPVQVPVAAAPVQQVSAASHSDVSEHVVPVVQTHAAAAPLPVVVPAPAQSVPVNAAPAVSGNHCPSAGYEAVKYEEPTPFAYEPNHCERDPKYYKYLPVKMVSEIPAAGVPNPPSDHCQDIFNQYC